MSSRSSRPRLARVAIPKLLLAPGQSRYPMLDSLRGIAIAGVIVGHASAFTGGIDNPIYGRATMYQFANVAFFFVMSGFLLFRAFAKSHAGLRPFPEIRAFLRRRVLRIMPGYWVALTVLTLWLGLSGPFTHDWWRYYGLLQVYDARTAIHGIPPAWSLCVEASFYLLLPVFGLLLAHAGRRLPWTWWRTDLAGIGLLALVGIVARGLLIDGPHLPLVQPTLLGQLDWFALGMALAVGSILWEGREEEFGVLRLISRAPWLPLLLAFGVWVFGWLQFANGHPDVAATASLPQHELEGLIALLVTLPAVIGFRAGGRTRRILSHPFLLWAGAISYGTYLWHYPLLSFISGNRGAIPGAHGVLNLAAHVPGPATLWVAGVGLALSMAAGAISYYVVELPFLRMKRAPRPAPPEARVPSVSPAVRPAPGQARFPHLDAIRGLAVVGVVVSHAADFSGATGAPFFGRFLRYQVVSIALFFVLSAFLLYRPFVLGHAGRRRAPSLRDFARRRALRIIPAYWVALTVLALWPGIDGPLGHHWYAYYGLGQVYSQATLQGGLGVAWTLCVEAMFYVLLPLVALGVGRLVRRTARPWWTAELAVVCALLAAGLSAQIAISAGLVPAWLSATLPVHLDWFALGMGLAVASVAYERREHEIGALRLVIRRAWVPWVAAFALWLFGVSLLGASATSDQGNPFMFPQLEIEGLIAVLLMLPAIFTRGGGGLIRRILADSRLAFVGVISYGIYLWHFPLIAWADGSRAHLPHGGWMLDLPHRVPGPVTLWLLVAGLGLGGVAGAISYYAVELPFLRMKDRPARDPAPARAAPELREASPEAA